MRNLYFKKLAEITIYLSVAAAFFGFNIHAYDLFVTVKNGLFFAALLLFFIFAAIANIRAEKRLFLSLLSLFFVFLIGLIINRADFTAALPVLMTAYAVFIWASLSASIIKDEKKAFYFLILILSVNLLYSLLQTFGVDFRFWAGWAGRGKIFTTIGNPNFSAVFIGMLVILLFYPNKRLLYLRGAAAITGIWLIFRAGSRGVFFSFIAALIMMFFSINKNKKTARIILSGTIVFIALSLLFSPQLRQRIGNAFDFQSGSSVNRLIIYKITLDKSLEKPIIGFGYEQFQYLFLDAQAVLMHYMPKNLYNQAGDAKHSHNEYLQTLFEFGIIGFAVILTIIISVFKNKSSTQFGFLLKSSLLILAFESLFSFPLHIISHISIFMLIAVLLIRPVRKISRELTLSAVIIAIILSFYPIKKYQANILLNQGVKGDFAKFRASLRLTPNDGTINAMLGLNYLDKHDYAHSLPYLLKSNRFLKDPIGYNNTGLAYAGLKKYNYARKYYEKAIAVLPANMLSYNNLGMLYSEKGEMQRALETYKKALTIDNYDENIYLNAGNIYINSKQYEKAKALLRRGLYYLPASKKLLYNIGAVYYFQRNFYKALEYFEKIRKIDSNYPHIEDNIRIIEKQLSK